MNKYSVKDVVFGENNFNILYIEESNFTIEDEKCLINYEEDISIISNLKTVFHIDFVDHLSFFKDALKNKDEFSHIDYDLYRKYNRITSGFKEEERYLFGQNIGYEMFADFCDFDFHEVVNNYNNKNNESYDLHFSSINVYWKNKGICYKSIMPLIDDDFFEYMCSKIIEFIKDKNSLVREKFDDLLNKQQTVIDEITKLSKTDEFWALKTNDLKLEYVSMKINGIEQLTELQLKRVLKKIINRRKVEEIIGENK